jgi:hypothetical protein
MIINYATLYRSAVAQVPVNLDAASNPVASILFWVIFAFIFFPDFILLN